MASENEKVARAREKAEKDKLKTYKDANPDFDPHAPAETHVSAEARLVHQQSAGEWPPQDTELQLQAAALEGRLTDEGAERLAEDLQDEGVEVEPEQLKSGEVGPGAPAASSEHSADAREKLQGQVDKASGNTETQEAKAVDADKENAGTEAQSKARKNQGAK
jgi:hypothetical protein